MWSERKLGNDKVNDRRINKALQKLCFRFDTVTNLWLVFDSAGQ